MTKVISIDEAKRGVSWAEYEIKKIVLDLQEQTGMKVNKISIERTYEEGFGHDTTILTDEQVKIEMTL